MSEPAAEITGSSAEFVNIIHPPTGNIAEVPQSALPVYYRAGWTLLTADNAPPADAEPEAPAPMTAAEAAATRTGGKASKTKSTEG